LANIRKELVLTFIQKYHPATVSDLKRRLAENGIGSTNESLLDAIHELQFDGTIVLRDPLRRDSFLSFLADVYDNWWILLIVAVAIIEPLLVYSNQSILGPLRAGLGLALLGYLPGYATVHGLFPGEGLKPLERVLMSIFLSVVISIAIGVSLGAVYQFTALNSTVGSSAFSIGACFVGAYREFVKSKTV
jgi:uncharacterized protein DUF1616